MEFQRVWNYVLFDSMNKRILLHSNVVRMQISFWVDCQWFWWRRRCKWSITLVLGAQELFPVTLRHFCLTCRRSRSSTHNSFLVFRSFHGPLEIVDCRQIIWERTTLQLMHRQNSLIFLGRWPFSPFRTASSLTLAPLTVALFQRTCTLIILP